MAAFAVYGPGSERSVAVKGFGRPEACETIHVSGRQFSVIPPRKLLVGFLPTAASEIIPAPHPMPDISCRPSWPREHDNGTFIIRSGDERTQGLERRTLRWGKADAE
ncbi:MAG: hypothetical protein ABJF67_13645, partial [Aurantimonas coralicida]